jgi:hypothetical protein
MSGPKMRTATLAHTAQGTSPLDYAVGIVRHICHVAGPMSMVDDLRDGQRRNGVAAAVRRHDTPALFSWLMAELSYQGIADRVAEAFIARHGNVTWADIATSVECSDLCPKLTTFSAFNRCGFIKSSRTCAQPSRLDTCPLPLHRLRNGRLNQTAYSLFFFIRDVANGDLIAWIDRQLAAASSTSSPLRLSQMRAALIEPMRSIYGVSDKVLAMALSSLLMVGKSHKHWFEFGASFVVVDTLVHNFLHRTGILNCLGADHPYGPGCYRPGGCADTLHVIAEGIDVSALNPTYPPVFPRFVQGAVWRYCASNGMDVCNGNRIDDRQRCANVYCRLYCSCDRVVLSAEFDKRAPLTPA